MKLLKKQLSDIKFVNLQINFTIIYRYLLYVPGSFNKKFSLNPKQSNDCV